MWYLYNDKYRPCSRLKYGLDVMFKFFMHRAAYCRLDIVPLLLRQRNPCFSLLFSVSLATQPFNNISPNFTRSFACSASLVHKLRMCCICTPFALLIQFLLLLLPRLSMIFAADATSEHQPIRHINIGIASQWCNSRSSDRSAKSPSPGCLPFSIFHFTPRYARSPYIFFARA